MVNYPYSLHWLIVSIFSLCNLIITSYSAADTVIATIMTGTEINQSKADQLQAALQLPSTGDIIDAVYCLSHVIPLSLSLYHPCLTVHPLLLVV